MTYVITQEYLKALLHYDPENGIFTVKVPRKKGQKVGDRAGYQNNNGYRAIEIDGKAYSEHRLAFLYMEGGFPATEIDHVNRVRDDNRFVNLRKCTHSENMWNYGGKGSKTLPVGVHQEKGRYRAMIRRNRKCHHLGYFDSPREAHEAYKVAKENWAKFNIVSL